MLYINFFVSLDVVGLLTTRSSWTTSLINGREEKIIYVEITEPTHALILNNVIFIGFKVILYLLQIFNLFRS